MDGTDTNLIANANFVEEDVHDGCLSCMAPCGVKAGQPLWGMQARYVLAYRHIVLPASCI
jgi:hypothetical protein